MKMVAIFSVAICLLSALFGASIAAGIPEGRTQMGSSPGDEAEQQTVVLNLKIEEEVRNANGEVELDEKGRKKTVEKSGELFTMSLAATRHSGLLQRMIHEDEIDIAKPIDIPASTKITRAALIKVIDWCEKREKDGAPEAADTTMQEPVPAQAPSAEGSVAQDSGDAASSSNSAANDAQKEVDKFAHVPQWAVELFEQFVQEKEQQLYFEMVLAANYLETKELLTQLVDALRKSIEGKTPAQIRRMLHVKDDFVDPEEKKRVDEANRWYTDPDFVPPPVNVDGIVYDEKTDTFIDTNELSGKLAISAIEGTGKQPMVDFQIGHTTPAADEPDALRQRKNAKVTMETGQSSGSSPMAVDQ